MHKWIIPTLVISILSVVIIFFLSKTGPFQGIENIAYDFRVRHFAPKTNVSDKIILVWLDEDTIENLPYRSPVPRDFLRRLNDKLIGSTPYLIAYDIFFQDSTSPEMDSELAETLSRWDTFSVSAGKEQLDGTLTEEKPLELFQKAFNNYGLSDLPISSYDATVRRFQPFWIVDGEKRPTFASLLYKAATGKDAAKEIEEATLNILGLKFRPYRKLDDGTISSLIRYAGPPGKVGKAGNAFGIFPAYLIAAGLVPEKWLSEKIILVGSAYEYSQDAFLTPYFSKKHNYDRMNGVEIHANVLNNLLMKEFYYFPNQVQLIILLALMSLLVSILALKWPLLRSVITILVFTEVYFFLNIMVLKKFALVVPFVAPATTVIFSFGLSLIWRASTEGKQKKFIKNVFSKYVSAAVADYILIDPSNLVLGGESRQITSLFTDIEAFTTISEKLRPEVLVSFLNEYLSKLSDIIFKYGGTVDKYEGDAVITFFGAPLDLPSHKEAAVRAAREIQQATREVSEKWKETCGREIVTRIGINSGPAVVGNMGSEERFDYTAIGDTVNLASRLEGTNKAYGTKILISEATKEGLPKDIECKYIDEVKVKGKDKTVKIYEV